MKRYQRPEIDHVDPYKAQPLPVGRPVAIYYRQSSEGQIGNISTTLQTVDMFEHLVKQGWSREQIIMIDMDAGVSGTKKISERAGMSYLFKLIENSEIGLVAAQDVDRFFRDLTQIETNIFIDVCRRNNVQVLTPTFVYDFAHPTQGRYHMQMFREQAQRAADFIEFHVKGRLLRSRNYMSEQGLWVGTSTSLGYMVDDRKRLPDETKNPHWRRFVPYEPHAKVVLAYFHLFKEHNGNLKRTLEYIQQYGPFVDEDINLPEGFRMKFTMRTRSKITGKLVPSREGLEDMLQNVHYLGYWVHKGVITNKFNHEPIVPFDLFMSAFNRLSSTDFYGDANPEYMPYRPYNRHRPEARRGAPPTYSGVVFSDAIPDHPMKRMHSVYDWKRNCYIYRMPIHDKKVHLSLESKKVDDIVDQLLIKRMKATIIDERIWQEAVAVNQRDQFGELKRLRAALREAEHAKLHILSNFRSVSHPEIVKNLEESYVIKEQEIARLKAEIAQLETSDRYQQGILESRPVMERVIQNWDRVPGQQRRELFDAFARRVIVSKLDTIRQNVIVEWRDGKQSSYSIQVNNTYYAWSPEEFEKLRNLVDNHTDQVEILRAFPGTPWECIKQRYIYHFGPWSKAYQGKVSYTLKTRWEDTEEYAETSSAEPK